MITKLTIGGRELNFTANAATPFRYKQLFHEDILQLLQSNSKAEENQILLSDTITKLAYIMNAQAEKKDMNCISFDDFMTWLEDFNPLDFVMEGAALMEIYLASAATTVEGKKK